ncbi:hypothetical protein [Brevundimonas basaltis]|uniref:hypothetical protein n=1 Tax=Brevundimonas basaltis TaxID=472166 RepID=UPI0016062705|nr:hypothetical protein [Brevundimonas basaltis]
MSTVFRGAASRMRTGHVVALSVLAAAAFGLVGLRAVELPGPRPVSDSDRLRIEIVPPVEPDLVPGSVMEVGELVDGFQGLPPPLPPLTDVAWSYDDGWDDLDEVSRPRRETRRVSEARDYEPAPETERTSAVRTVQRWFGFDAPQRDFQAEREARRARLDAMERDAREARARERRAAERYRHDRAREDERRVFASREARGGPHWRMVPPDREWREPRRPLPPPDFREPRPERAQEPSRHLSPPPPPDSGPRPYYGWSD